MKVETAQAIQQHAGAVGTGLAGGGFATFVAAAEPVMKLVSFTLASVVAVLTIIWYIRRLRSGKHD